MFGDIFPIRRLWLECIENLAETSRGYGGVRFIILVATHGRVALGTYTAHDPRKDDLLRTSTAAEAAGIVAEMDEVLESRLSQSFVEPPAMPEVTDILAHMSAYMGHRQRYETRDRRSDPYPKGAHDAPVGSSILWNSSLPAQRAGDPSVATMATDGISLFYNPGFIDTLTTPELVGVLAHEVMHPGLQHHTRRGDRSPYRWNKACDYAINPLILDAGLALPKDVLFEDRFRGLSAERIYNLLEEEEEDGSGQGSEDREEPVHADLR